ncbi:hypothetical protein [Spiroplasma monobiae]|uniref:Uncharacterized protein n=1 Tax=Spiroplasma monobiae MQ-1 TaxID=1336748 RepID=A0A2K9LVQ2_SPISQ|nr:hypothetical protein [Spiroplasma monobiae]AUM62425.1 hypothetical protein SMONO_v1c01740 [Spiroplasma monobiae MQ-1]
MEQHLKYPFCCKDHSNFFSTLLENYIKLRPKQEGIVIINEDFQLYKELTKTNLKLIFESEKNSIKKWNDNLIDDLEKKLWSIASIMFIYYVFHVFELNLNKEVVENFEFLKDQSINLHNSIGTLEIQSAFKLIFQIIDDIKQIKEANIY